MIIHADKKQAGKSRAAVDATAKKQSSSEPVFQFVNSRPETIVQRKLQEIADNSAQMRQRMTFQEIADNRTNAAQAAQLQKITNYPAAQPPQTTGRLKKITSPPAKTLQAKWILNKEGERVWVPEEYELKEGEMLYKGDLVAVETAGEAEELLLSTFKLGSGNEMCSVFAEALLGDKGKAKEIDLTFSVTDSKLPRFTVVCESVGLRLLCNQEDAKTMRLDSIRVDSKSRGAGKTGPQTVKCLLDLTKRNVDLHRWILVAAEELGPYAWASMGWAVRDESAVAVIGKIITRFGNVAEELKNVFFLKKYLEEPQLLLMKQNAAICELISEKRFEEVPGGWGRQVVHILTKGEPRDCMRALANVDKGKKEIFIPRLYTKGNEKVVMYVTLAQALTLSHDKLTGEPSGAITWEGELKMKEGEDLGLVEKYLGGK